MGREREGVVVGSSRTQAHARAATPTIRFEWMSFSGHVRLLGAEEVLRPGTSFWGALAAGDRTRVRARLERAARDWMPLELSCRLDTRSGARTFLLQGEVVAGAPGMAPRVMGVLLEISSHAAPELGGEDALAALLERLAGALGDDDPGQRSGGPRTQERPEREGAEA